jgi:O-antigen/teichoic acid export membrane protein
VYIGRAWRFGLPAVILIASFVVLGIFGVLSTFVGMATYFVASGALYLYAIADPPLLARHLKTFAPRWY